MFKKILLITSVSLTMLLSSCTDNTKTTVVNSKEVPTIAKEFQYKGHDYIMFRWNNEGYDKYCGYVHNPECNKCFDIFD